jgi:hypothetical protein
MVGFDVNILVYDSIDPMRTYYLTRFSSLRFDDVVLAIQGDVVLRRHEIVIYKPSVYLSVFALSVCDRFDMGHAVTKEGRHYS